MTVVKVLAIVGLVALVIAIVLGVNALMAWGAQYVLAAFNIHVSFWVCFVAVLVLGGLLSRGGSSK